jgi:hypothetical protein
MRFRAMGMVCVSISAVMTMVGCGGRLQDLVCFSIGHASRDHDAPFEPDGSAWPKCDVFGLGDRQRFANLPVAEEWNHDHRRDRLRLHYASCDPGR